MIGWLSRSRRESLHRYGHTHRILEPWAPETGAPCQLVKYVLVQSTVCLTGDEIARCGGRRRGTNSWWLRRISPDGYGFVRNWPNVPGDAVLDVAIELLVGRYEVGVGARRTPSEIRCRFTVDEGTHDRPVFVRVFERGRYENPQLPESPASCRKTP